MQKKSFTFKQGIVHQDYLLFLYKIFIRFCPSPASPKISKSLPHYKTGEIYTNISFTTYTLPCFNELYNLFYVSGKKVIPSNTAYLLTAVSLAYWICDDGSWNKVGRYVTLCTDSFTLSEVEFLIKVLNKNFDLNCYIIKNLANYRIVIPAYSVPNLQQLVSPHIPPMMSYKIGL